MLLILTFLFASFDPAASIRALKYDEGRAGILVRLFELNYLELQRARSGSLGAAVAQVAMDPAVPFADRVVAIRALNHLTARGPALELQPLLKHDQSNQSIALARETARTFFRLGAGSALLGALGSHDPEVRSYAARAGQGGSALCMVLRTDIWPQVRAAAADGLASGIDGATCLLEGLKDSDTEVVRAAVKSVGEASVTMAVPPLEALVKSAQTPLDIRVDALFSLGQLGALRAPQSIVRHHLEHGGLVVLTQGALSALIVARADSSLIEKALKSSSSRVALTAARGLLELEHPRALDLVRHLKKRLTGRARAEAGALLEHRRSRPALEGKQQMMCRKMRMTSWMRTRAATRRLLAGTEER